MEFASREWRGWKVDGRHYAMGEGEERGEERKYSIFCIDFGARDLKPNGGATEHRDVLSHVRASAHAPPHTRMRCCACVNIQSGVEGLGGHLLRVPCPCGLSQGLELGDENSRIGVLDGCTVSGTDMEIEEDVCVGGEG